MPVLFGLDLKEMQWYKFGSKYMFGNSDYYLRRTKFGVYQGAMIFCVISESLGTDVLSDFVDSQDFVKKHNSAAIEHNDDYIGMASYNIFAGIFVAFIFGAAFFFDLFWPARHEDRGIRLAWKGSSITACIFMLASIILEVIIVATKYAHITGVSRAEAQTLVDEYGGYPLKYNKNARAITSVVFAWLGFAFTVASTVIMWMSINHIEKFGPYSAHVRKAAYGNDSEQGKNPSTAPAAEMNNLGGNHYEAPGVHREPPGHIHENPTQIPEPTMSAAMAAPYHARDETYAGT